jgi:hypothetical protein
MDEETHLVDTLKSDFETSLPKSWTSKVRLPEKIWVAKHKFHRILVGLGIDVGTADNAIGLNDIAKNLTWCVKYVSKQTIL